MDLENRVAGGLEGGQDGLIYPGPLSPSLDQSAKRFDGKPRVVFQIETLAELAAPGSRDPPACVAGEAVSFLRNLHFG